MSIVAACAALLPMRTRTLLAILAAAVAAGTVAFGETVTVQEGLNGYSGTDDTYASGRTSLNSIWANAGAHKSCPAAVTYRDRNSLLYRFSGIDSVLGSLGVAPENITDAKLYLYTTAVSVYGAEDLFVWRMTHTWNEGIANWSFANWDPVDGANNVACTAVRNGSGVTWTTHGTYGNVKYASVSSKAMFFARGGIIKYPMTGIPFDTDLDTTLATVNSTANSWYSDSATAYVNSTDAESTWRFFLAEDEWPNPGYTDQTYFENSTGLNDVYDSTDVRDVVGPASVGQWTSVDITEWVQDWIATPANNHGVLLRSNHISGDDRKGCGFSFSEYDADAALRPKLEITYEIPEGTVLVVR